MQAGIEILVKVRLQREGFEHVFDDPYSADLSKLRSGEFRSVSLNEALKRLAVTGGIRLSKSDYKALQELGKERNKLQHFGSTSTYEVVNAKAAAALDVLVHFILEHLIPGAPAEEKDALNEAVEVIRAALPEMEVVSEARMVRIQPELDACIGIVIHCPNCRRVAWEFDPDGQRSRCLFCNSDWNKVPGDSIAKEYAENIFDESWHLAIQGRSGWSILRCPECEAESFLCISVRGKDDEHSVCFECGFVTTKETGFCTRCEMTLHDPDEMICGSCLDYISSKD
ncbi:hypothetical protein GCM10027597_38400 [Saccharopolyspora tripterygii]